MKIIVLDGHTINPGDLSWKPLKNIGEIGIYERTPPELVIKRSANAGALLVNKIKLGKKELEQLPKLKYIGITATGFDNVDIQAVKTKGITVTNVAGYSTASVAQHTFALLLELTNHSGVHNESVKKGEWAESKDFSYFKIPLVELQDKVFGIYGYGSIGREVAKIAKAFGMKILVCSGHSKSIDIGELVSLEALFKNSDVISIHKALNAKTNGVLNHKLLSLMKNSAFLINTGRGAIINENDLAEALSNNTIAGAALDVLATEPPSKDNPLLYAKNCIITPHIAWGSNESRQRLMDIVVDNLKCFMEGNPQNVVNA